MKRMAVTGFIIWLVATIALRLAGQYVFRGGSPIPLLIVTLPVMIAVAIAVLQRYRLPEQRALAAIALVAPGMLLDTISAIWFPLLFPNIRADAAGAFGGWLLFCNVVVLLTAVLFRPSADATA
jgi:hypothetical protein